MCEWACHQCGEAFWGHPPESGICIACQDENAIQAASEVTADET